MSIARTHMHKDVAAAETLFTFSGTKSSLAQPFRLRIHETVYDIYT